MNRNIRRNAHHIMEPIQGDLFHGAAIIDASGEEIPITESMIQETLDEMVTQEKTESTSEANH